MHAFKSPYFVSLGLLLAILGSPSVVVPQEPSVEPSAVEQSYSKKIFLIGNSLTWDTLPGLLDGDVQWHVDCGKNLKYIYDNPDSPCVKTSTLWPEALSAKQYDILAVQPHFGTSLDEDVEVISNWLNMQPQADVVIHTGWTRAAEFEATYVSRFDHAQMAHAPPYFDALIARMREKFPHRSIRSTQAIDALENIRQDITKSQAPFQAFTDLYRDSIHMTAQAGRYLMHNLMRLTLGQSISVQGFQIEETQKHYLDQKLEYFRNQAMSVPN